MSSKSRSVQEFRMTDFHSHILPGIDDGAQNIRMSKEMLELEKKSGIKTVVATPHFYLQHQTLEDFLEKRTAAYDQMTPIAASMDISVVCGAEVYFTPSLIDIDLSKLCIGNTRYIMIELPYTKLSDSFIKSFHSFVGSISSEITPILAHAERYLNFTDENSIYEIMETDMLVQLNSRSFKLFSSGLKFMLELLRHNMAHLLGTDCHNTTSRPPNMEIAEKVIGKKISPRCFEQLMENAQTVISDRTVGE